jgi:hypothetical protein
MPQIYYTFLKGSWTKQGKEAKGIEEKSTSFDTGAMKVSCLYTAAKCWLAGFLKPPWDCDGALQTAAVGRQTSSHKGVEMPLGSKLYLGEVSAGHEDWGGGAQEVVLSHPGFLCQSIAGGR